MTALRVALAVALGGAVSLALAWLGQRRLLYFPTRYELAAAEAAAAGRGLRAWAPSGAFLGWRAERPGARGTLVVLHGNAGSALDRTYFARAFAEALPELPLDVVLVEYPGYGPREGSPTEASLVAAAREAVREARRNLPGPVILAGESLGTAVAALAAAEAPVDVDGLVLVTPLASVPAVGRRHYPFLPVSFFRDPLRADLALPRYGGPVAFLVAEEDEVVFPDLGRALFEAYPGPKRLWTDPGAGHNTVDWRPGLARWGEMVALAAGKP
jgi:pimeloyl-ACP methyl ester carboxylesterase